jgi:hypothetical protein
MLSYWPASIVEHGLGLNITVQSYCGSLDFGLIAARTAVPNVGLIADHLREAHAELLALRTPGTKAAATGGGRKAARRPATAAPVERRSVRRKRDRPAPRA